MALKKPSDYFNNQPKEPNVGVDKIVESMDEAELSTFSSAFGSFKKNLSKIEALSEFSEALDNYNINVEKIDYLSEKINEIQLKIENFLSKQDLDNAMVSQLLIVEGSIIDIQNKVEGINKKSLSEINQTIRNVEDIVANLVENEIPSYKKIITSNEVNFNNKVESLEDSVFEEIENYRNVISEFIINIDEKIKEHDDLVKENKKIISEQDKKISSTSTQIINVANIVNKKLEEERKDRSRFFEEVDSKISDIKSDVVINEEHLRKVDKYLQNHHSRVINLREEVFNEIKKLPIGDFDNNIRDLEKKINRIEDLYSSINTDALVENVIKEGLLNEPAETKNSDPLTPLDQNFVTQQELQNHYKLFLNRIQQQLSTIGGGGETKLKYLDDIVGIATNPAAYDGKVLSYNHALRKFEFIVGGGGGNAAITISDTPPINPSEGNLWYDSTIGRTFIYYVDIDGSQWVDASPSGGVPQNIVNTWITTSVGIHTLNNVGIGTTNPTSKLTVNGDVLVAGVGTIGVSIPTQLKTKSVAEKTTIISGNNVELAFSSGGGNVAICTNPTGNITLNVISIPTDSSFDNHSISFSVIVTQSGTARTCTTINLNGVSRTIRWSGGSLANAISGVTTSSGYDIFTFTGINTVGSASTTENYVILGSVNGGFN